MSLIVDSVRGIKPSATLAINELSAKLKSEGRTVYRFGLGQSPFPVPAHVVRSLQDNAHQKDYLEVQGHRPLRQAVAAHHNRLEGTNFHADDVVIGPGSKELMFILQLVFAGETLLPSPSWVSYQPQAKILNRAVKFIPTEPTKGWRLQAADLAKAARLTPQPKILILNYPGNPDGLSYSEDELKGLAEVARQHRIIILSDEIYGLTHHQGAHVSISRFYPEGTIVSGGISKWCGAGGWRLGTFVFPRELHELRQAMRSVASETFTSVSAPIQHAAVAAYRDCPEMHDYLEKSRAVLRTLGRYCAEQLRLAGATVLDPVGGFYLWADFSALDLKKSGIQTNHDLCRVLLEKSGIAVLPGSVFGRPAKELTFRLAYVDFDGAATLQSPPTDCTEAAEYVEKHCPQVFAGMQALRDFFAALPAA